MTVLNTEYVSPYSPYIYGSSLETKYFIACWFANDSTTNKLRKHFLDSDKVPSFFQSPKREAYLTLEILHFAFLAILKTSHHHSSFQAANSEHIYPNNSVVTVSFPHPWLHLCCVTAFYPLDLDTMCVPEAQLWTPQAENHTICDGGHSIPVNWKTSQFCSFGKKEVWFLKQDWHYQRCIKEDVLQQTLHDSLKSQMMSHLLTFHLRDIVTVLPALSSWWVQSTWNMLVKQDHLPNEKQWKHVSKPPTSSFLMNVPIPNEPL